MTKTVGLWIDHRKAVIVALSKEGEVLSVVESGVEKHPGRIEGVRSTASFEAQQVVADDSRQRKLTGDLRDYCDRVIAAIGDAGSILILGPGEAKGELERRLAQDKHEARVAVQAADRMTDRQLAAHVREFFAGNATLA